MRIRPSGPDGCQRPFKPAISTDEQERHGDALDHIAVSLAAIDHNLEALVLTLKTIASRMNMR